MRNYGNITASSNTIKKSFNLKNLSDQYINFGGIVFEIQVLDVISVGWWLGVRWLFRSHYLIMKFLNLAMS